MTKTFVGKAVVMLSLATTAPFVEGGADSECWIKTQWNPYQKCEKTIGWACNEGAAITEEVRCAGFQGGCTSEEDPGQTCWGPATWWPYQVYIY